MTEHILEQVSSAGANAVPLIATSRALARLPGLPELLGVPVVHRRSVREPASYAGVIAWGRKASATTALRLAERHGLRLLRLEDGFLRSVGLGNQEPPLSVVVDELGIYYDATAPSRLETLIAGGHTEAQQSRARAVMATWVNARASKYNHAREYEGGLPKRYVLVADQTRGDASIRYGRSDESSFQRMFAAALSENPECMMLLKAHPDVTAGRKRGYFDFAALAHNPRVRLLTEDAHPAALIQRAEAIYVVTSQIGFEGLLWGRPVHTFGMPFFAGWGLTRDTLLGPRRRMPVPLESLVHAALVEYPRYIDPETGKRCEVERVLEWIALQRRMRGRFPATVYATRDFSAYKKSLIRSFFQGSRVVFCGRRDRIPSGAAQVVWGRRESAPLSGGTKLVCLEDGFIRSVGLGANMVRPLSLVLDQRGIYYDPTHASDLELILQNTHFDAPLLDRARALRQRLVADGMTKYNVGATSWSLPRHYQSASNSGTLRSRRVILVPGQVESDASLLTAAPGIRRNLELLRAVRAANPAAYVIYKLHPDVVAGLRRNGTDEAEAARWCDEVLADVAMSALLPSVDEVHTITSLSGFEALLRGKKVVCHGQPFYAGWGLTEDMHPIARRTRCLSLDELVAGTLILYPIYLSRTTGRFTTPERALDELLAWRASAPSTIAWWPSVYRFLVKNLLRRQ